MVQVAFAAPRASAGVLGHSGTPGEFAAKHLPAGAVPHLWLLHGFISSQREGFEYFSSIELNDVKGSENASLSTAQ